MISAGEETYHGIPPIRAPHWRWLVAAYFFFGGIGGGASSLGALAAFRGPELLPLVRPARYLSAATLAVCPVLLTLDLGRPERAHHMFRIVKLKSPMSLGSWALLLLGLMSGLLALVQLRSDALKREAPRSLSRILGLMLLPFGLFVSGYTGLLLAVSNVPIWARGYRLLGPTFMASAFSSASAILALLLWGSGDAGAASRNVLRRAEGLFLLTELALLCGWLKSVGSARRPLTRGRLGLVFWPVTVVGGLLVPLILNRTARGNRLSLRWAGPLLVLVGSFSLRTLILLAGHESADRPQDYFDMTK